MFIRDVSMMSTTWRRQFHVVGACIGALVFFRVVVLLWCGLLSSSTSDDATAPVDKLAYATFVDDVDSYLRGARALACSLRRAGVTAPFLLLVPRDRPAVVAQVRATAGAWARVVDVPPIAPPATSPHAARFERTWSKLNVWALDEWDRIIFIDADCVVMTPRVRELEQRWHRAVQLPAFASDTNPPDVLNSGVMVLRPDLTVFLALRATISAASPETRAHWRSEQDVLNDVWGARWFGTPRMLPAHFNWHAWQTVSDPERAARANPTIVHYSGVHKPWYGAAPRAWQPVMRAWHLIEQQCQVDLTTTRVGGSVL